MGGTTPATLARLSWASSSLPRGTMNCCPASGFDAGRRTPAACTGETLPDIPGAGGALVTDELLVSRSALSDAGWPPEHA